MRLARLKITKVLMVGSSLSVKGGMTTVVESFLQHNFGEDIVLKYIPTHIENVSRVRKSFYFFISLLRITIELIFGNVNIVHMHMSERGSFKRKYIILNLAKLFRKKVITHTHGAEFKQFYESSSSKLKARINRLLKESDVVITLGESWNNIIKEIEPEANTIILRNSVKLPSNKNNINNNKIKVLFLAILSKRKGILDLIKASPKIIKELNNYSKQIEFIIAGDGELLEESKSLVSDYGINSNYKFVGWVKNKQKHDLLKETDLFILPSYNEGLPLSILEAISYGIPVISTNVGSINEAVKSGENGYLITPGDVEKLAEYTIRIIMGTNFKKMGQGSRKIAENFFNIDRYFEDARDLYHSLNQSKKFGDEIGIK